MSFKYGGFSKVGFKRENNEDFLLVKEFDPECRSFPEGGCDDGKSDSWRVQDCK